MRRAIAWGLVVIGLILIVFIVLADIDTEPEPHGGCIGAHCQD